jgi:ribosomal protein S17E
MNVVEYLAMIGSYVIANIISGYIIYRLKGKKIIRDLFLKENKDGAV